MEFYSQLPPRDPSRVRRLFETPPSAAASWVRGLSVMLCRPSVEEAFTLPPYLHWSTRRTDTARLHRWENGAARRAVPQAPCVAGLQDIREHSGRAGPHDGVPP
ncbi:hypothetical protein GCM10022206_37800 [Streptomyces chiangmaiensis]